MRKTMICMVKLNNTILYYKLVLWAIFSVLGLDGMNTAHSRHIIGGDMRYICLGKNSTNDSVQYRVICKMYRDSESNGANFDFSARFGIYREIGNNVWDYVRLVQVNVKDVKAVPPNNDDPCIIVPPNLGVEEGTYEFTVWLPVINQTYMIAYQRCCRNPTISNLFNPDDAGAAFTITISALAQQTCNNSPSFTGFPPVILCVNEPLTFDHSATDAENDQVVYEFCSPLSSGGQLNTNDCRGVIPFPANCLPPFSTVNFLLPGFSFSRPMAGDPVVSIHPQTGLITGTPRITGQFVVGVCIKEYRNGILLSSTQRDFQFNVQQCSRVVTPRIAANIIQNDTFIIRSCEPGNITLQNLSLGGTAINSYDWELYLKDTIFRSTQRNARALVPDRGSFFGKLVLNKLVGCKDSLVIRVDILPELKSDFDFQYDTCVAGPVQFINTSFVGAGLLTSVGWFVEENLVSSETSPVVLLPKTGVNMIKLEISDSNLCKDTLEQTINWSPVPALLILQPDETEACVPASIGFNNLSKPVDETYKIQWIFGDKDTSNLFSPEATFNEIGTYDVSLQIVSPIGCVTKKVFEKVIQIHPNPVAGFLTSPDSLSNFSNQVTTTNVSEGSVSSQWYIDNVIASFENEPVFTIKDTGIHIIRQVAINQFGCSDTADVTVDVEPLITLFMPDAFTPNKDGLNDEFIPVGYFQGIKSYEMLVYNRWGEKIFESNDIETGWDGKTGEIDAPVGNYIYQLNITEPRGKIIQKSGYFLLIK